jgi:thimet oligopeptidase
LHGVLSLADYNGDAGTATVQDFVEAPSQMFEEWVRRPESLRLFRQVCSTCPELDPELIKRINQARKFGAGIYYARQLLYASYDMSLTGEHPGDALEVWNRMEAEGPLGHVEGTIFPANFQHIANNGYGAGYYGYMWSQVLALDMLAAFGDNLMNPEVGQRFRATILANGGQVPAKDLVRQFLGREPNSEAFFAEITGKR